MNYLAHAVLSGPDPHWTIGGYLGDHVRGGDWRAYPKGMAAGILLHRRIDAAVDHHPVFRAARAELEAPFRRYAGILLDMYFDHCLAVRFESLCGQSLERFAAAQYRLLGQHREHFPETLRRFVDHMQHNDLLVAYREPEAVERALAGVGRRLTRDNPLDRAMPHLQARHDALARAFETLWPDLLEVSARERRLLGE